MKHHNAFAFTFLFAIATWAAVASTSHGQLRGRSGGGRSGGRLLPPMMPTPPLPPFVRMTPLGPVPNFSRIGSRRSAGQTQTQMRTTTQYTPVHSQTPSSNQVQSSTLYYSSQPTQPRQSYSSTPRYVAPQPYAAQSPVLSTPTYASQPTSVTNQLYHSPVQSPASHERRPVSMTPTVAPSLPAPIKPKAENTQNIAAQEKSARRHFELQRYSDAVQILDQLVDSNDSQSKYFQFRSFAHFALGDFESSAADAYDALSRGNTWDWKKVYELYGNEKTYESQLRKLESKATSDTTMTSHFLLGYHYLVIGHHARARSEFERVIELQPDEPLATHLLSALETSQ